MASNKTDSRYPLRGKTEFQIMRSLDAKLDNQFKKEKREMLRLMTSFKTDSAWGRRGSGKKGE